MIKDMKQLNQAKMRISEIKEELFELQANYKKAELMILASPLIIELEELEAQIDEYEGLTQDTFEESMRGRLRKPVLLDEIGELLAKLRIAAGLTQKDVAELLGWKQSNISRFENEEYQSQTIAKVAEYADGLGVWLYIVPELEELREQIRYRKSDSNVTSWSFEKFDFVTDDEDTPDSTTDAVTKVEFLVNSIPGLFDQTNVQNPYQLTSISSITSAEV